jgi:hypothetical protein
VVDFAGTMFGTFILTDDASVESKIFKSLSGENYTNETCAALCYMEQTDCHFFILDQASSNNKCLLGNLDNNGDYTFIESNCIAHMNDSEF